MEKPPCLLFSGTGRLWESSKNSRSRTQQPLRKRWDCLGLGVGVSVSPVAPVWPACGCGDRVCTRAPRGVTALPGECSFTWRGGALSRANLWGRACPRARREEGRELCSWQWAGWRPRQVRGEAEQSPRSKDRDLKGGYHSKARSQWDAGEQEVKSCSWAMRQSLV